MRLFSNMLTFNRVKDGEDGKQGPMPANYGLWNKDFEYIKDEFIQPYVYMLRDNKKYFYLLVADKSKGDNPYINNTQGSGDIWRHHEKYDLFLARKIQADEIDTANLVAANLKTGTHGARIEASGSEMKVYGYGEHPNIIFGVNSEGYAVLAYYANDGSLIYDLGPRGINWGSIKPSSWTETKLVMTQTTEEKPYFKDFSFYANKDTLVGTTYYRYYAGNDPTITETEREKERYLYYRKGNFNSKVSDGWYMLEGVPMQTQANNTTAWVRPFGDNGLYEFGTSVRDVPPIYFRNIFRYEGGKVVERKYLCWNGDPFGQGEGGGFTDPRF